jgi:hypothetical protein
MDDSAIKFEMPSVLHDGQQAHYCYYMQTKLPDSPEIVFQKQYGEIDGNIYLCNSNNELVACPLEAELQEHLQQSVEVVGRMVVRFVSSNTGTKEFWFGSGFKVSNNVVVTARHVVKEEHQMDGETWRLEKVWIVFLSDASSPMEFNITNIEKRKEAFELEVLSRFDLKSM